MVNKSNPHTWNFAYVKEHQWECVDTLEWLTACLQTALGHRGYSGAIEICNQICAGFDIMVSVFGVQQYGGGRYTYSFLLAEIAMFGIGSENSIPLLEIAHNYAFDYIKSGGSKTEKAKKDMEMFANMIRDVQHGLSLMEVRRKYDDTFPDRWLE